MQSHNENVRQQDSSNTFEINVDQKPNQQYLSHNGTSRQPLKQKISQSLDLKNIALLIVGKALIIIWYFLFSNFKLVDFMFVTILISVDFWMNKNIYGKHLAGLRWWIELDQYSEEEHWVFQSADPNIEINYFNNGIFWITNLTVVVFWFINFIVFFVISQSLFWMALCLFSIGMTSINILCFYKCRGNHQKKLKQLMQKVGIKSATHLLMRSENMKDLPPTGKFQIQ